MSIDRYVKFISEQAINSGMSTPQLNEEWKVKEVHKGDNFYSGERGGGQEEGTPVSGTLVHRNGHVHKFTVNSQGRHSGTTRFNERGRGAPVKDLETSAHEKAMKVWEKKQNPDHSSRRNPAD
jgi:hypothetical protein